jgi:hypothetical protein
MQIWELTRQCQDKMTLISVSTTGQFGILSAWTGVERGLWERAKAVKVKCTAGQVKSDAELAKYREPVSSSCSELVALKTEPEWGCCWWCRKVSARAACEMVEKNKVRVTEEKKRRGGKNHSWGPQWVGKSWGWTELATLNPGCQR